VFKLEPQDTFVVFYVCLICFQLVLLLAQKVWSPKFVIPDRFKELFLHAAQAQYQYRRQFMDTIQYTLGTLSSKEAIDSLNDDQCAICMNNLRLIEETVTTSCDNGEAS